MIVTLPLNPSAQPNYLTDVRKLWREHSATLGFFTAGAFQEYAARNQIIIAVDSDKQCIGYLLYRVSRDVATVVHLCVDKAHRGSGVAKRLVDLLKTTTKNFRGIGLYCRRDFDVSNLWPKLGFIALKDKEGRSHDGKLLTYWWFDHGHPTLFSEQFIKKREEKICAVIDANVFFDIGSEHDPESEESKALLADWVQENVQLYLTQEIFNEINRQSDRSLREREQKRAHLFSILEETQSRYSEYENQLRKLFPHLLSCQDESDIRQLARAISADAQFFVTRDSSLLDLADKIYENHGITILRPADLIVHLDSLEREGDYRPVRLAGSHCQFRLVKTGEVDQLTNEFQHSAAGESAAVFRRSMVRFLSDPKRYVCNVVVDANSCLLGLIVYSLKKSPELEIPLLRLRESSLAKTLARYLLTKVLLRLDGSGSAITKVTDLFLQRASITALMEAGYVKTDKYWAKISIPVIGNASEVAKYLLLFAQQKNIDSVPLHKIASELTNVRIINDVLASAEIELALWPAKITDLPISNWIIPIKPAWAKDLFDEHLAAEDIFGAKLDLALQQENVYYRKNYFAKVTAPGRILWYVSQDTGYPGSGYVRACSRLDEVLIDKPKSLYSRFRRLGIYEWRQVYETAGNNVENEIMAIKFSHTELFDTPVSWSDMQMILKNRGVKTTLESPISVDPGVFIEIYRTGRRHETIT